MSAPETSREDQEEEKASQPQNQERIPTTPEITRQKPTPVAEAELANPSTPVNLSTHAANAQNQQKVSSSPEITEEKATDTAQAANAQNQQKVSSSPDITEQKATADPSNNAPEPTKNNQNQEKQSNVQEISPAKGIATSTEPPNLYNSAQFRESQSQETGLSSVPKITPEEAKAATTTSPLEHDDTSAKTTTEETTDGQKKSDETEAPKKDSTTGDGNNPPENETLKQDSTNGADQPPKISTQKQDPTTKATTNPQDITSKQDSFTTDVVTPQSSKKDSICLPLLGFHKSKEKKPQSKEKKPVQDDTETAPPGKDEHSKSTTDPQKPAVLQGIAAAISDQDEHAKSTSDTSKPAVVQDSRATSGIHECSKSTTGPKKPILVQDTASTSGKDEHSKSITDPQKTTDLQGSAITSAKDVLRKLIDADIKHIEKEANKLDKYKNEVLKQVDEAKKRFDILNNNDQGTNPEFDELRKMVTKLKLQIPSRHKADAQEKDPHKSQQDSKSSGIIADAVKKQMPQLYKSSLYENCVEVKEFEALFHRLSVELKLCFLCFAVFPENAIIKKRLMVYWWIAEGFVPPRDVGTGQQDAKWKKAEEFADKYFVELTRLGFIEPVNTNRSFYVGCYKMHPFVRLALIMMAEKFKFFNFDGEGNPTKNSSGTLQACLMGKGLLDYQDLMGKGLMDYQDLSNDEASGDLKKLHAVFNINESILDFKPEWFSMMKNLNILHLGSWKVSPTDHIEVEESNFLNGLSSMKHLKFFSLQGVSNILEIPESISKLSNLIILDLRACHNLESIPEGIHQMTNLTYLDISECYLLGHMPEGISKLINLRVLKGFVVGAEQNGNGCNLNDLKKLKNLIKLSIYTGLGEFPTLKDLKALKKIENLKKLTMTWGGSSLRNAGQNEEKTRKEPPDTVELKNLEKLDLKCFPKTATPGWLMPSSLKSLKKLYIRGGKFSDLGQYQYLDQKGPNEPAKNKWNVEILLLKFLGEIKMDWKELQNLFPDLIYLEKVNCPKLSFFPTDGYGVWIHKEKSKQMQARSQ